MPTANVLSHSRSFRWVPKQARTRGEPPTRCVWLTSSILLTFAFSVPVFLAGGMGRAGISAAPQWADCWEQDINRIVASSCTRQMENQGQVFAFAKSRHRASKKRLFSAHLFGRGTCLMKRFARNAGRPAGRRQDHRGSTVGSIRRSALIDCASSRGYHRRRECHGGYSCPVHWRGLTRYNAVKAVENGRWRRRCLLLARKAPLMSL